MDTNLFMNGIAAFVTNYPNNEDSQRKSTVDSFYALH